MVQEAYSAEADWDAFDPDQYLTYNYAHKVLEEDRLVMQHLHERMSELATRRSLGLLANVGHGGAFAVDIIMQDFVQDNGCMELIEYGAANRAYMHTALHRGRTGDMGIWQKFEDTAVEIAPHYRGGLARAFHLGKVVCDSIYRLAPNTYDGGTALYCPESITAREHLYRAGLTRFARSIRSGGPFAMAFMRNSAGYTTPGQLYPAYPVECDEVEQLLTPYISNLEVIAIEAPRGMRPADGPQYDGVGLATGLRR